MSSPIHDACHVAVIDQNPATYPVYLHQQVKTGDCVIVGRGASSALLTTPGVFHVFVHASMKRKVEWFTKNFAQHAKGAEQENLATDRRRAAYVRRFYNRDWTDYRLCHLILNSCMGFGAMVKATIEAAGLAASVPSMRSSNIPDLVACEFKLFSDSSSSFAYLLNFRKKNVPNCFVPSP